MRHVVMFSQQRLLITIINTSCAPVPERVWAALPRASRTAWAALFPSFWGAPPRPPGPGSCMRREAGWPPGAPCWRRSRSARRLAAAWPPLDWPPP
eukprot:5195898-Pyramimonas_sp.AAC.1